MKSPNDGRDIPLDNRSVRRLVLPVVVALGLLACGPRPSSESAAASAAASDRPASNAPASDPLRSPATTVATGGGLRLVAAFDRLAVAAGASITVELSIENTRSTDVVFEEPCQSDTMTVDVLVPVEPIGRDWDGIAAAFKTYALREAAGSPIESSIRTRLHTTARATPCHAADRGGGDGGVLPTTIIQAGTRYETVLTWPAEILRGIPAIPGPAPFSIKVRYDQAQAGGLIHAATLEASGVLTVLDGAPSAISAGMALDAALADPPFATWLAKQPKAAWVNANLFLQPAAIGVAVLPVVPYWDVELYREPRNWAILYIDATSGAVLGRMVCDIACDR